MNETKNKVNFDEEEQAVEILPNDPGPGLLRVESSSRPSPGHWRTASTLSSRSSQVSQLLIQNTKKKNKNEIRR